MKPGFGRGHRPSLAFCAQARAEDWPTRAITLIVPFAPGGGVDLSARIQAQRMSEMLGQPIVVENIGAAAGMAGGLRVAKSAPDGYTMLIGNSGTHAFNQSLYKKPLYNSVTDFTPVGLVIGIAAHSHRAQGHAGRQPQEFVAYVKAHQANMQFGSAGVGSGTHLPCVLLNLAMGVNVTHVPYRGEGPAQQDLIAGRLDYMCSTIQTGAVLAAQGEVKGIAVMSPHRVKIIADLATTGEQGLPGVEASVWNAFFLPTGAPRRNRAQTQQGDERYARRSRRAQASGGPRPRNRPAAHARRNISPNSCPRKSHAGPKSSTPPASRRISAA